MVTTWKIKAKINLPSELSSSSFLWGKKNSHVNPNNDIIFILKWRKPKQNSSNNNELWVVNMKNSFLPSPWCCYLLFFFEPHMNMRMKEYQIFSKSYKHIHISNHYNFSHDLLHIVPCSHSTMYTFCCVISNRGDFAICIRQFEFVCVDLILHLQSDDDSR